MSNSSLVSYTRLSPCNSGKRTHAIDRITPHCVVGQASVEGMGSWFQDRSRETAPNYGIGADGRVGLYVNECDRSWCSSSNANDQRAVTIECASDDESPYAFRSIVYDKLVELCVDICKRNGKTKLIWIDDRAKALAYEPKTGEMVLTVHRWFANKSCPGDWLYGRLTALAATVTEQLAPKPKTLYLVQTGAFSVKGNAASQQVRLKNRGFDAILKQATVNGRTVWRVQIGAFGSKANAEALAAKAKAAGFDAIVWTQ